MFINLSPRFSLSAVLVALCALSVAHAQEPSTYHVAQQHPDANDSNPGTSVLPWRTIQHAADNVSAGDTVIVHAGVYTETAAAFPPFDAVIRLRHSGTAQNPIRFIAAFGEQVVIDTQNGGPGFMLIGIDHITIQGFEIRNARTGGIWTTEDGCDGVEIIDNHIHHVSGKANVVPEDRDNIGGIRLDGCNRCLVEGNVIHDVEVPPDVGGGNASNGGGIISFAMQDSDIRNNRIFNAYNGVMHKRSTGGIGARIQRNIIHDVVAGLYYLHSGIGDPPHRDAYAEENHIFNCTYGVYALVHESVTPSRGFYFHSNAFHCDYGLVLQGTGDVHLMNNIIDTQVYSIAMREATDRPVNFIQSDFNVFAPRTEILLNDRQQQPPAEPDYPNLASWRLATGLDTHSREGHVDYRIDALEQAWLQPGSLLRSNGLGGGASGPHNLLEQVLGPALGLPQPPTMLTLEPYTE